MKQLFFVISFILLTLPAVSTAKDSTLKNAGIDIIRFEKQANGLTPARRSNARRILKLLNLSHQRLQQSTHQNESSWQEINQRYLSLKTQLTALISPSKKTNTTPNITKKTTQTKAKNNQTTQQKTSIAPLVSGQRVRVKKLARDITNIASAMITTGPSELQNGDKVAAYKKRLKQFSDALVRYPQLDDADVQNARKAYTLLRNKLSNEFQRTKKQLTELGDVQKRLSMIEENNQKYAVPMLLTIPFNQDNAETWVKAASSARTVAEHNLKELAKISPIAYLPNNRGTPQSGSPYDANDVLRLSQNSQNNLQKLQNGYHTMADKLENRLKQIERDVLSRFQEDPNSEKRWIYLGKGRKQSALKLFAENTVTAQSSVYLETALGRKAEHTISVIEKLEKAKQAFLQNYDTALNSSKLPKAESTDSKMLALAKNIVEKPKYKFGQYGKIVLTTSEIVERERKDSEVKIDDAKITLGGDLKMKGTETTWTYKWKEFKFAVPLKDTDENAWHIWWITAKNFSSGGNRTPLSQWVSGKATQGNLILEKNIK